MEWLSSPETWISLVTLTLLEIVLGIDNIVFISILAGKLPRGQQKKARQLGLMLALGTRILLLCALAWMVRLTKPWFSFTLLRARLRDLGARLDPDRGWVVPADEEHARDSREA
jgi:predicted tellurium resistance membrane protein TerC